MVPSPLPSELARALPPDRYFLSGGGAPVPAGEVEHIAQLAIEVVLLWGSDILGISHLAPPGSFFLGGPRTCSDVCVPEEFLGGKRLCIAVSSRTEIAAVLPAHARGWSTLPDGSTCPFPSTPGASTEQLLPLALGCRAHLRLGELELQVATVAAGRAPSRPVSLGFDTATLAYFGATALLVVGTLSLLSLMAPALGLTDDEQTVNERLYTLQTYIDAAEARVAKRDQASDDQNTPAASAAARRRAPPSRAEAASDASRLAPPPSSDALLATAETLPSQPDGRDRHQQLREAKRFGTISLLGDALAALNDPQLHFRRELSSAEQAEMQQLFNPDHSALLDGDGPGGLALSGTGLRGGGKANVLAIEQVETIGRGEGEGLERAAHFGSPSGSYRPQTPALRASTGEPLTVLTPALVRSTVDAQLGKIRACYQPNSTEQAVVVRFVVRPGGQVDRVSLDDSALPLDVRTCIAGAFQGLRFPISASAIRAEYPLRSSP